MGQEVWRRASDPGTLVHIINNHIYISINPTLTRETLQSLLAQANNQAYRTTPADCLDYLCGIAGFVYKLTHT